MTDPETLRQKILALTAEYADEQWPRRPFVPGETPVPVSGLSTPPQPFSWGPS